MVHRNTFHASPCRASTNTCLELPAYLDPAYWEKHRMSVGDIAAVVDHAPPQYLWLMVVSYGGAVPWSNVRISHAMPFDVLAGGRSAAVELLVRAVGYVPHDVPGGCLSHPRNIAPGTVPVPRCVVTADTLEEARRNLVIERPHEPGGTRVAPVFMVPGTISLYGARWAPVSFVDEGVRVVKVVDESTGGTAAACEAAGTTQDDERVWRAIDARVRQYLGYRHEKPRGTTGTRNVVLLVDECIVLYSNPD